MQQKYYIFPFGDVGDKAVVQDETQIDGVVSYEEGWGGDYELEVGVEAGAKDIPLPESNQLMFDATENIKQYQEHGTAEFITSTNNDGSDFPYDLFARCIGPNGLVYESKIDANTDTPPSVNWNLATFGGVRAAVWGGAELVGALGTTGGSQTSSTTALNNYRIAVIDEIPDQLQTQEFIDGTWLNVGNALSLSNGTFKCCTLTETTIAVIDGTANTLQAYSTDGTDWTTLGSSFALDLASTGNDIIQLTDDIVVILDANNNEIQAMIFNGSTWSTLGNSFSVTASSNIRGTALTEFIITVVDSSNETVQAYIFDDALTDWDTLGELKDLNTIGVGTLLQLDCVGMNETDICIANSVNPANGDQLFILRFNSLSTWTLEARRNETAAGSNPDVTATNGTDVTIVNSSNDNLATYRWNHSSGEPHSIAITI